MYSLLVLYKLLQTAAFLKGFFPVMVKILFLVLPNLNPLDLGGLCQFEKSPSQSSVGV